MRHIGVLMPFSANDQEAQDRIAAFLQGLRLLGWTEGRDLRMHYRSGTGDADRNRRNAAELVALARDVILTTGNETLGPRWDDAHRAHRVRSDCRSGR